MENSILGGSATEEDGVFHLEMWVWVHNVTITGKYKTNAVFTFYNIQYHLVLVQCSVFEQADCKFHTTTPWVQQ